MNDENKFDGKKFGEDLRDRIHREVHERLGMNDQNQKKPIKPMVIGIRFGRGHASGGLFWGALLVLGGIAFLLDNMGYIHAEQLWRFWPLLLVCAGIANFVSRNQRVWGVFLMGAGVLFQLNELGIAHFRWGDIWPFLLIAGGLMLMWRSFEDRRIGSTSQSGDAKNTLNELAVFGGIEKRVTSQDFQGGNVTAIFGGIELDLRQANMQADQAVMEVNSIFGGCEIRVPESWSVISHGQGFFGGYTDSSRLSGTEDLSNPNRKTLIVKGAAIFGGVELKN